MRIWLALIAAPLFALADQGVSLSVASWACAHQQGDAIHGIHVVFLAASIASTALAWRLWRGTAGARADGESSARRHFLAGVATATGALSVLVIAALWIPNWLLSPCIG